MMVIPDSDALLFSLFVALEDGALLCFGSNEFGQLGNGTIKDTIDPIRAGEKVKQKFVAVKCGEVHTVALTGTGRPHGCFLQEQHHRITNKYTHYVIILVESGRVYTFGSSNFGQLGLGDTEQQMYPRPVESIEHQKVIEIACGAGHSMALTGEKWLQHSHCIHNKSNDVVKSFTQTNNCEFWLWD
jgi:alpha-tubulin suppressor-like RCC1 family protein